MRRIVLVCLMLIATNSALADSYMRCGVHLVPSSASVAEFLDKCGEPTSKEKKTDTVRAPTGRGTTFILGTSVTEIWTYDRGPQRFPIVLTIIDGRVTKVETLKH